LDSLRKLRRVGRGQPVQRRPDSDALQIHGRSRTAFISGVQCRTTQSSVKPSSMLTCQLATRSPSMCPRVSVTRNQRRLCTVLDAFAMANRIASSELADELPVIWTVLYT